MITSQSRGWAAIRSMSRRYWSPSSSLIMVITCFLMAFGRDRFLNLLIFDSAQVLGMGRVWQIVTYGFVHAPYRILAALVRSGDVHVVCLRP